MKHFIAILGEHQHFDQAATFIRQRLNHVFEYDNEHLFKDESCFAFLADITETNDGSYQIIESEFNDLPIVAQTRIDNKKALLATLPLQTFENEKELLLSHFEKNGITHFQQPKGSFIYVLWDKKTGSLHASIDTFNCNQLYYLQCNGLTYLSTSFNLLASHPSLTLQINQRAIAQWLAGQPPSQTSMFENVSLVPCGMHYQFSANEKITKNRIWDIDNKKKIRYNKEQDYQEHFFSLLHNSVNKRFAGHSNTIFCQMSGGLDSTTITAHANIIAKQKNIELHTVSHTYKDTASCNEIGNIKQMINKLKLKNCHFIELDQFNNISFTDLYPTDITSPGIVSSPKYQQELSMVKNVGANILLTGNGGDETCWGHSATYRSRLLQGDIKVINEVIQGCKILEEPVWQSLKNVFIKPLIPSMVMNLIKLSKGLPYTANSLPAWLTVKAKALIKAKTANEKNPYSSTLSPAKHARYDSIFNTSTFNAMRSYEKVAKQYQVEVRHPFFDENIIDFSFAIPEKLLIQGIYPKWLLRNTMNSYLPHSVCWNKTKVVFDYHFANLIKQNAHEIRAILSHTGLQALGLLDNKILLNEFDKVINAENSYLNVDLLYAILTQSWFQKYGVNSFE